MAAGMQGHIAKPLDVTRLVRELQRYRPPPPPEPAPPVLDMGAALRQFDGQAALYRRTLQAFAEQYATGVAGWAAWQHSGDWAELRRAAHTLQGLAATIGAQPLHRLALALERSAASADAAATGRQLEHVDEALTTLLGEIRAALARQDVSEPPAGSRPGDLAELQHLLSQSDSRALDWWQAHGPHAALDDATRRRLQQALAALDFDAALLALKDTA
jgi:HPt (histidine-containing phosphotransfer) domain-containing protein